MYASGAVFRCRVQIRKWCLGEREGDAHRQMTLHQEGCVGMCGVCVCVCGQFCMLAVSYVVNDHVGRCFCVFGVCVRLNGAHDV